MGLLGIEKGKIDKETFKKDLEQLGFKVLKIFEIRVKTKRGWIDFTVADVIEPTEGYASYLSTKYSATALEGGEHLIFGEVSAKLWNEAVKISYPDGSEETITILIHDNFLNAKIPTENIEGIKGEVLFNGFRVELPIKLTDLLIIVRIGKKALEKIDKLVQAYGREKILSREVIEYLEKLTKVREEVKESIDYETGFVIIAKGTKISTIPIPNYIVNIIKEGNLQKALKIYREAPNEIKQEIEKAVTEELEICKAIGRENEAKLLSEFLNKIKEENQTSNQE